MRPRRLGRTSSSCWGWYLVARHGDCCTQPVVTGTQRSPLPTCNPGGASAPCHPPVFSSLHRIGPAAQFAGAPPDFPLPCCYGAGVFQVSRSSPRCRTVLLVHTELLAAGLGGGRPTGTAGSSGATGPTGASGGSGSGDGFSRPNFGFIGWTFPPFLRPTRLLARRRAALPYRSSFCVTSGTIGHVYFQMLSAGATITATENYLGLYTPNFSGGVISSATLQATSTMGALDSYLTNTNTWVGLSVSPGLTVTAGEPIFAACRSLPLASRTIPGSLWANPNRPWRTDRSAARWSTPSPAAGTLLLSVDVRAPAQFPGRCSGSATIRILTSWPELIALKASFALGNANVAVTKRPASKSGWPIIAAASWKSSRR